MLGQQRLARLLGVSVALCLATPSCESDDGRGPSDRSTEDCSDACAKIAAADCGDVGSACVDQCVRGPLFSATASGDCESVERVYFNCFWAAVAYACDETLGTLPVGCDDQRDAVKACESGTGAGGAPGVAGAGGAGSGESGAGGAMTTGGAAAGAGGAP